MAETSTGAAPRRDAGGRPLPSPAIVVEWENVALAESARANRMLLRLGEQLRDLAPRFEADPEVLVLFDPDEVQEERLAATVDRHLREGTDDPFTVQVVRSPDAAYYEQKNRGARRADRDVVVFLDSDVVPEEGWLENVVSPFADPGTDVVAGHTYMVDDSPYETAFKYFWFFPTRDQSRDSGFFANNVAFRRDLFLDYEFPDRPTFRGQCGELATQLQRDGVGILQQSTAVCSHPPPNGWTHFVTRALCTGYDYEIARQRGGGTLAYGLLRAAGMFVKNVLGSVNRIAVRRRVSRTDDDLPVLLAALALGVSFYLLAFVGQVLTAFDPDLIGHRLHI